MDPTNKFMVVLYFAEIEDGVVVSKQRQKNGSTCRSSNHRHLLAECRWILA